MELPRRSPDDVYLPDGSFPKALDRLRQRHEDHDLRIGIVNAFDFRTRMLPYWYADTRMAPASVRTLGDALDAAGFREIRIVLQQWTPNFKPSEAVLNGKPLDILMISSMQVHAEPSYDLIRDAHRLGDDRPLILVGGPKAIYEPTDYFELGPDPGVGADCVVTGEVYVLLDLLQGILAHRRAGDSVRNAFESARRSGALEDILGLVYLSPDTPADRPVAVNTGVQRILRNLDEMPLPDAGYRMLEPAHKGRGLRDKPYSPRKVGKRSIIASIVPTQGCKFKCSFCPIPGLNQGTWRHKSPERFAAEIKHIYETFGIREFFGTDDNFFNQRETVVAMMSRLAKTTTGGVPLSKRISFYTESTQFDAYKNRDLLPLCAEAGLNAIWLGIEDITAELVNKGQTESKTAELFALMCDVGIQPMVMMIHSDDQPLRTKAGNLSGLLNQARYVFDKGAVSYQCTYLGPSVGSRDFEPAAKARMICKAVGGHPVLQAYQDGNHVVASRHTRPWQQQTNILRAYASFYNPLNALRVLGSAGLGFVSSRPGPSLTVKRFLFQILGQIGWVMSFAKLLPWARKLKRGPIEMWDGLQHARIPMVDAVTGQEMNWAIEHLPSLTHAGKGEPLEEISGSSFADRPNSFAGPLSTIGSVEPPSAACRLEP